MAISARDIRIKLANAAIQAMKTQSGETQVALTADEIDLLISALESYSSTKS